jgi:hypothetical protein
MLEKKNAALKKAWMSLTLTPSPDSPEELEQSLRRSVLYDRVSAIRTRLGAGRASTNDVETITVV